jgi:hypothetical protein
VLNNPTLLIDAATALWIVGLVSLIFMVIPSLLLGEKHHSGSIDRLVNGFVRMSAVTLLGTLLWARMGLLTWFTAVITVAAGWIIIWTVGRRQNSKHKIDLIGQKLFATVIDVLDRGVGIGKLGRSISRWIVRLPAAMQITDAPTAIGLVGMFLVLSIAGYLRFYHPLAELRFTNPNSYGQLLVTQQMLARDTAMFDLARNSQVPVLAALTALISLLGSVDAMHAQHFTMAIVGCWLVAALGYFGWKLTDSLTTGVVGMLSLGVYLFTWSDPVGTNRSERTQIWLGNIMHSLNQGWVHQWNPGEVELGVIFLLLGLATAVQISQRTQRFDGYWSGGCCLLLVVISAPPLVLLLLIGGIGLILGRQVALFLVAVAWFWLAILSAIPDRQFFIDPLFLRTFSIDLSLLLAIGFLILAAAFRNMLGVWTEAIGLILALGIALNFFWPSNAAIEHVEYEASARKTLEISRLFPYKDWTLVAPNEQLSQSFRQGWYEDLAKFVEKYQGQVGSPSFRWPIETTNLFVMVEKKPFQPAKEYDNIPFSTLTDPVYINYRSSTGRAKLQAAAEQLCADYARSHPGSKIYYQDEVIKIYQFPELSKK